MNRRAFLEGAGKGSLGLILLSQILAKGSSNPASETKKILKAADINNYLRSLYDVPEPSVDRILIGRPDTVVSKIGIAWMPYWQTCRQAVAKGINTLVVHEPAFAAHWGLQGKHGKQGKQDLYLDMPVPAREAYTRWCNEKVQWINKNGLVLIRCHDVLDRIAEFGIPHALGKALGFSDGDLIRSKRFFNVYKIPAKPALDVAKDIAARLKVVGQPGVAFYGDENYLVSSVGVGTGCICDPNKYMDLKPDLFLAIDDTIRTWVQTVYAADTGRPLVVINHGTSEEFGMRMFHAHLNQAFPDTEVIHLAQGCGYRWVTGKDRQL